jgi:hypothetical protein
VVAFDEVPTELPITLAVVEIACLAGEPPRSFENVDLLRAHQRPAALAVTMDAVALPALIRGDRVCFRRQASEFESSVLQLHPARIQRMRDTGKSDEDREVECASFPKWDIHDLTGVHAIGQALKPSDRGEIPAGSCLDQNLLGSDLDDLVGTCWATVHTVRPTCPARYLRMSGAVIVRDSHGWYLPCP